MLSHKLVWTALHARACKASAGQPELCFAQVLCSLMDISSSGAQAIICVLDQQHRGHSA